MLIVVKGTVRITSRNQTSNLRDELYAFIHFVMNLVVFNDIEVKLEISY